MALAPNLPYKIGFMGAAGAKGRMVTQAVTAAL